MRENHHLVGWVMTQDDGAIGLLTVIKEHRRKGYGYELMLAVIHTLRPLNQLPFLHIEEDNIPSTQLALKLGFKKEGLIHWFKLNNGEKE